MPQLDNFAYVSQVIWLFVLFFTMYIYLIRISLPRIYKILYIRKHKLVSYSTGIYSLDQELFFLNKGLHRVGANMSHLLNELPLVLSSVRDFYLNSIKSKYHLLGGSFGLFNVEEDCLTGAVHAFRLCENNKYLKSELLQDFRKKSVGK